MRLPLRSRRGQGRRRDLGAVVGQPAKRGSNAGCGSPNVSSHVSCWSVVYRRQKIDSGSSSCQRRECGRVSPHCDERRARLRVLVVAQDAAGMVTSMVHHEAAAQTIGGLQQYARQRRRTPPAAAASSSVFRRSGRLGTVAAGSRRNTNGAPVGADQVETPRFTRTRRFAGAGPQRSGSARRAIARASAAGSGASGPQSCGRAGESAPFLHKPVRTPTRLSVS